MKKTTKFLSIILFLVFASLSVLSQDWPVAGTHNVAFTFNSGQPNIATYPDGQHNAIDIAASGSSLVMVSNSSDIWEIVGITVPSVQDQAVGVKNVAVQLKRQGLGDVQFINHLVHDPNIVNLYQGTAGNWMQDASALYQPFSGGDPFALVAPMANLHPASPQFEHVHVQYFPSPSSLSQSILSHPDSPYSFSSGNYVDPMVPKACLLRQEG